jgi:hypothetical protein
MASPSVTELAAARRRLYWISTVGRLIMKSDLPEFEQIVAIENEIARADFNEADDKRRGSSILMEDKPSSWDNFQEKLFLRMQQFA